MALLTDRFAGTELGPHWTFDPGAAGNTLAVDDGVTLTVPTGVNYDTISSPSTADNTPGIYQLHDGTSFDVAVRFDATDMTDFTPVGTSNRGHGLLVFGDPASDADGLRAGVFSAQTQPQGFSYARAGGVTVVAGQAVSQLPGPRGGIVSWLRLAYQAGTGTYSWWRSPDGVTWTLLRQFVAAVIPRRVKVYGQARSIGYACKVGAFVNLAATPDPRLPVPDHETGRVWSTTFADGQLPDWLVDASNPSTTGGVSVAAGAATMRTDLADGQQQTNGALAWAGPTDYTWADLYVRYRHAVPSAQAFGVVGLQDGGVDIDVYSLGSAYIVETNGGNTDVRMLRVDRTPGPEHQGTMQFLPYTYWLETTLADSAGAEVCTRVQRLGQRVRARHWLAADLEPAGWDVDADDWGWPAAIQPQVSLGRNPTNLGSAGTPELEVYELVVTELVTPQPAGPERDLQLQLGAPETALALGQPATGWLFDEPETTWAVGAPSV